MKNLVEIYFPIAFDYNFEEYPFEQKDNILKEISIILKEKPFEFENYIIDYDIQISQTKYDESLFINTFNPFDPILPKENSLKFTIDVTSDTEQIDKEELEDFEEEYWLENNLVCYFSMNIFELLLLSQIARPGSLKLRKGNCYFNKKLTSERVPKIIHLRNYFEYRDEKNYPEIKFLDFTNFYTWIKKNNCLFPKKATNGYQRSLNNLTYVSTEKNEISEFVFKLRILEDLYTNNNTQITEQLNEKIQLFLGKMTSFTKQIKKMYSVRSDFLHGRMNIEATHKLSDIDYLNTNDSRIHEASSLSILLVISTLQKMFEFNLLDLKFETRLRN